MLFRTPPTILNSFGKFSVMYPDLSGAISASGSPTMKGKACLSPPDAMSPHSLKGHWQLFCPRPRSNLKHSWTQFSIFQNQCSAKL